MNAGRGSLQQRVFASESTFLRDTWGAALLSCREAKLVPKAPDSALAAPATDSPPPAPPPPPSLADATTQPPPGGTAGVDGDGQGAGVRAGVGAGGVLQVASWAKRLSAVSTKGLLSTLDELISDDDADSDPGGVRQGASGDAILGAGPAMLPPGCEVRMRWKNKVEKGGFVHLDREVDRSWYRELP